MQARFGRSRREFLDSFPDEQFRFNAYIYRYENPIYLTRSNFKMKQIASYPILDKRSYDVILKSMKIQISVLQVAQKIVKHENTCKNINFLRSQFDKQLSSV